MFQSQKGIYCIDTSRFQIIENIGFKPNSQNNFSGVDPLAQALYNKYLLSINRNNYELVILDKKSKDIVKSIQLGKAPNGPNDLVVVNSDAIIAYPEFNSLIFVDLEVALQK
jgi:hypothetical protein